MIEVQAPHEFASHVGLRIFLAGSIEMGAAEDWQRQVVELLGDLPNLVLLNPRRDDWDSSWEQSIEDSRFRTQVEWELAGLEAADLVAMYLHPETKAPISLLELGLMAGKAEVMVCCPPGYWRRGNVEVVCSRYGLELHDDVEEWKKALRRWADARVGEPVLRPPPQSRELEEREEALRRDPSDENLRAYWNLLRRLGVVETEEFRITVPGSQGWGSGDWKSYGFLGRITLATLGDRVGEPGPHLEYGLFPSDEDNPDLPGPDRQFFVERRIHFDVRTLTARYESLARIEQDALWRAGMRAHPPEKLVKKLADTAYESEVPLLVALADIPGWIRMESRRALARAVHAIREGLRP